jgi:hypothetical protein
MYSASCFGNAKFYKRKGMRYYEPGFIGTASSAGKGTDGKHT